MPAIEWLKKYESLKNKLACKTDLDTYFSEKIIGNMKIDVLDIGSVHFPTGKVIACDPLVSLVDAQEFMQTIPAGTYPVQICVVPSEKYGDRYACVKVTICDQKPVRYELAMSLNWDTGIRSHPENFFKMSSARGHLFFDAYVFL